jgi:excisionase family DNA binding protein
MRKTEPSISPKLINATQVAEMLNSSIHSVKWLVRTRQIPFRRIGAKNIRFSVEDIREWLEANKVEPNGR